MEDSNLNQKPLRKPSTNKIKDIYETYLKNDKTKNIPISDGDNTKVEISVDNDEQLLSESANSLNDEAFIEMQNKIEQLNSSLSEANSTIESLKSEVSELKELSLRKTAELENFRKRSMKEKSDLIDYANEKLLTNFVEILDDLTNAVKTSSSTKDSESIIKGLELMLNKTKKLFDEAGVKQLEFSDDTLFDVNYHEAMMMAPSDKPEGTVIQVLQNGYTLKEKVLRHAKVITSSGNTN
ncbi:nucleotide exchange factor GrpE [Candidatus Kapaibacterium sp.]